MKVWDITRAHGAEAARRSYADTVAAVELGRFSRPWLIGFAPERLTQPETEPSRAADEPASVAVLELEQDGNLLQQRFLEIRALLDRRARTSAAHPMLAFGRE